MFSYTAPYVRLVSVALKTPFPARRIALSIRSTAAHPPLTVPYFRPGLSNQQHCTSRNEAVAAILCRLDFPCVVLANLTCMAIVTLSLSFSRLPLVVMISSAILMRGNARLKGSSKHDSKSQFVIECNHILIFLGTCVQCQTGRGRRRISLFAGRLNGRIYTSLYDRLLSNPLLILAQMEILLY